MFTRAHLLGRAAQCQRLTSEEAGAARRIALALLRDMWVALARESEEMRPEMLAGEIAAVERIQSDLCRVTETAH